MELTQILLAGQSPDQATRKQAEDKLNQAEQQNPAAFFTELSKELSSEDRPANARQLAGIVLKNALTAKDRIRSSEKKQRWVAVDESVREGIRQHILTALKSPVDLARQAAAQAVSVIGGIELPLQQWATLLPALLENVLQGNDMAKHAALTALGYLAEELSRVSDELGHDANPPATNSILTAVVQGMRDPAMLVKVAALKAFYYALVLARTNFNNETERNYMVQVLLENCNSPDSKVKIAAMECLVQVASEYYDFLTPYMSTFGPLTWNSIKSEGEDVAIPAMEFWSSICDEEYFLKQSIKDAEEAGETPDATCLNFISQALPYLLPILLETLTKQESEDDEDSWTIAMAAGTCLSLVAQVVGDEVVSPVLAFVNVNFGHADWKHREAAILAYGSIMEGPSSANLAPLVSQSFQHLVSTLQDSSVAVRDTAAWTIGRIAQFHTQLLNNMLGNPHQGLVVLLLEKLKDEPRVASNICWIINVLAEGNSYDRPEGPAATTALSPFFPAIAERLLEVAERPDGDEKQLREAAYTALSMLISKAGEDCIQFMDKLMLVLLDSLERTFQFPNAGSRAQQISELQGMLCGGLQVLTVRLREKATPCAERLFSCYLRVFQHHQSIPGQQTSLHEEALLAVSALANALGEQFERWMPHFAPLLMVGLGNFEEQTVCKACQDVVGDLSRALGPKMATYCEPILMVLYNNIQNPRVDRSLKPGIMVCFGDMAMAIAGDFEKYIQPVVAMLQEAGKTSMEHGPKDSEEWITYIHKLRDGVLQAYTGIIHGMKDGRKLHVLKMYVNGVLELVQRIADDPPSEETTASAIAVTGDLIMAYQQELTAHLVKVQFLEKLIKEGKTSHNPDTRKQAKWLQELLQKYRPNKA